MMPNLVDNIGVIIASMRFDENGNGIEIPFYMYGHNTEINNRLLEKEKNSELKYKKYPLIALRLDTPEDIDGEVVHYNLNLAIMTNTSVKLNSEQRQAKAFKLILYPLYEDFLLKLKRSGLFMYKGRRPPHTKIDRYYWGTETAKGNDGNLFDDPIDAIEILNLKMTSNIKC